MVKGNFLPITFDDQGLFFLEPKVDEVVYDVAVVVTIIHIILAAPTPLISYDQHKLDNYFPYYY